MNNDCCSNRRLVVIILSLLSLIFMGLSVFTIYRVATYPTVPCRIVADDIVAKPCRVCNNGCTGENKGTPCICEDLKYTCEVILKYKQYSNVGAIMCGDNRNILKDWCEEGYPVGSNRTCYFSSSDSLDHLSLNRPILDILFMLISILIFSLFVVFDIYQICYLIKIERKQAKYSFPEIE